MVQGVDEKARNNILICDPSGQSTSPAALVSFLLLKYQVAMHPSSPCLCIDAFFALLCSMLYCSALF
jgi:hypothetical protein